MPDTILGLDIGKTTIKAVQIVGGLRGFQVTACAKVDVDPESGLKPAIESLCEQIPVNGSSCATSVSPDRVSFRNLTLPFTDRKKIEQILGYELEPLLPFSVDSVTTTYISSRNGDKTSILAACVRNDLLEKHLDTLKEHAFDPDVIEVGDAGLVLEIVKRQDGPEKGVLLDIGAETSSLTVFVNGAVVLMRPFHFGGDYLTRAIAEARNVPLDEAEGLKIKSSGGEFTEVVRPAVSSFCREIRNTLHAFRCQVNDQAVPDDILLTGGGARLSDVPVLIEEELGLPVELLDLGARMNLSFDAGTSTDWDPLTMNNALALAFREAKAKNSFNLRAGKFKKTRRYDQFKGEFKRIGIYLAALVFVFCAQFGADYYVLKKQRDHLSEEITTVFSETFPDVKNIVKPVHQMQVKIREAKEAMLLPAETVVQKPVVDLMRDIALRIPAAADLDVSTLVIDEERARLKGLTDTFNTVDEIKKGLQDSEYWKEVTIGSAQLDRVTEKVRFEMIMVR